MHKVSKMDRGCSMARWTALLGLLSLWCNNAIAQSVFPATWNASAAAEQTNDTVEVLISQGEHMVPLSGLLPLTSGAVDAIPPPGLVGTIYLANDTSMFNVASGEIVFISCDPSRYPGNIQATNVFSAAVDHNASAIVLYTEEQDYCNLSNENNDNGTGFYQSAYSIKNSSAAQDFVNRMSTNWKEGSPNPLYANVLQSDQLNRGAVNTTTPGGTQQEQANTTSNGNSNGQNENPLGPSPSTAVAMIILYSITGIITALFLVIIVTGAVRAHRHPERYGPRNIMGRARQSRARGLARAMLDSLPIVKFGEREEDVENKPGDVEMTDTTTAAGHGSVEAAGVSKGAAQHEDALASPTVEHQTDGTGPQESQRRGSVESVNGIAPAAVATKPASSPVANPDHHQGCSICTEDFEVGQDQRVLPCDHRFHPECVDPWLLNVSGTCPLCRIDLRPQTSSTEDDIDEDGNPIVRDADGTETLPPPLSSPGNRSSLRRSIFYSIRSMVIPDHASPEDRTFAARRVRLEAAAAARREQERQDREQQQQTGAEEGPSTAAAPAAATDEPAVDLRNTDEEDERRRRRRLSSIFGIRTRRTERSDAQSQQQQQQQQSRRESSAAQGTASARRLSNAPRFQSTI